MLEKDQSKRIGWPEIFEIDFLEIKESTLEVKSGINCLEKSIFVSKKLEILK